MSKKSSKGTSAGGVMGGPRTPPPNGPSKTGRPSGSGRGNNPPRGSGSKGQK